MHETALTGISSHLGAKLRDWADRQAEAGCYSWAALSSNDSNTRYFDSLFSLGHIRAFLLNHIKSTISYPITAVASHETAQPSNVTPLTAVEMNNPPPPPYPTLPDVTTTQQSHQQQQVVLREISS